MEEKLFLSSDGYDRLESYTTALYGERGSFYHNVQRYIEGDDADDFGNYFQNSCRIINNFDDISEHTNEGLKQQISWEESRKHIVDRIQSAIREKGESNLCDADYYEIAGIMGLCPGRTERHETLFPHIVDLFVNSEEAGQEIHNSIARQPNIVNVMVRAMLDGIWEGRIIRLHNGKSILSKGYARSFWRGESALYGSSVPSIYRCRPDDPDEAQIFDILGQLRMIEFSLWIQQFDCVKNWPHGDVFHGAIAQHYDIRTSGIDITSNLKAALFFACCVFDKETKKFRPLRECEYAEKDSRQDVSDYGGDSRYGIIFHAHADVLNMCKYIPNFPAPSILQIGYQPFQRCSAQSGYILEGGRNTDLYKTDVFSKFKFKHNRELHDWIFEEMNGGDLLFPNEGLLEFQDVIKKINALPVYSESVLKFCLERLKNTDCFDEVITKLKNQGHHCVPTVSWCDPERIKQFELSYEHIAFPIDYRIQFSI